MEAMYKTLEFNLIIKQIAENASSSLGKDVILSLKHFHDINQAKIALKQNDEGLRLLYAHGEIILGGFYDVTEYVERAMIDGVLQPDELILFDLHVNACQHVSSYRNNIKIEVPLFLESIENLEVLNELQKRINDCLDDRGYIKDTASKALSLIRREYHFLESQISSRMNQFLNTHKDQMAEMFVTKRNNRFVVPVKLSAKTSIKGMIHGESASGQTIYIEPEMIFEMNNQLGQLKQKEKKEIERILFELSQLIKMHGDVILENLNILTHVDVLFAKAKYAKALNCEIPRLTDQYETLSLIQARHPLIDATKVVANDITISKPMQMMLITGSNTGGKSVTLKTVGLLSLMALSGLAIPASKATIPFFHHLFVDLGDGQSIAESLSTYSSHLKRMIEITENVDHQSLVLLDELGSGTDPRDGENLAIAILDYLYHKGALVIATTHYAKLKRYATQKNYVMSASVEFDLKTLTPTYRLKQNQLGKSYALEIASQLGLNQQIIDQARIYQNADQDEYEVLLEKLQHQIDENQSFEVNLMKQEEKLNEMEILYQAKLSELDHHQYRLIEDAKQEANQIIIQAKDKANQLMKELKQKQVLKVHEETAINHQLDTLLYDQVKPIGDESHEFKVGDTVKIISLNTRGEIDHIYADGSMDVSIGGLKSKLKKKDVIYESSASKVIKHQVKSKVKRPKVALELNLIGQTTHEAKHDLDQYINQALLAGLPQCRIIHGFGTGALRKMVHSYLDKNKHIETYRLGDQFEGGNGATVVYFK